MMYTQCPSCKAVYRITVPQLRAGRGEVLCQECQVAFNALNSLSEAPKKTFSSGSRPEHLPVLGLQDSVHNDVLRPIVSDMEAELPRMTANPSHTDKRYVDWESEMRSNKVPGTSVLSLIGWGLGGMLLAGMLLIQVLVFEGREILRNVQLRPWFELACDALGCKLPDFRARADIQIVTRSLRPTSGNANGLDFSLVIANQSSLPQTFPAIKLSLTGMGGRTLQSRVFKPSDYLTDPTVKTMPVGKPFEIHLLLAKPESEVAGFVFDLI
jgi:predicted Zn finger-like uncharacterized protein